MIKLICFFSVVTKNKIQLFEGYNEGLFLLTPCVVLDYDFKKVVYLL